MEKFDLTKQLAAQDMISLIMLDKNLSQSEAVKYAVHKAYFNRIFETGWAGIALDLWGHADYDREWQTLENPVFEVELDDKQISLINSVMTKQKVDKETALTYFLIFTMEDLGYHI